MAKQKAKEQTDEEIKAIEDASEQSDDLHIESISVDEIPVRTRAHKYDTIITEAKDWEKGAGVKFTTPSRSSVQSLKNQLKKLSCDLVTQTNKDGSVTVYAYRPK